MYEGRSSVVVDDDDDDDDDVGLPTADSAGRISQADYSLSPASTPCSPRPDSPHSSSSSSSVHDFDVVS